MELKTVKIIVWILCLLIVVPNSEAAKERVPKNGVEADKMSEDELPVLKKTDNLPDHQKRPFPENEGDDKALEPNSPSQKKWWDQDWNNEETEEEEFSHFPSENENYKFNEGSELGGSVDCKEVEPEKIDDGIDETNIRKGIERIISRLHETNEIFMKIITVHKLQVNLMIKRAIESLREEMDKLHEFVEDSNREARENEISIEKCHQHIVPIEFESQFLICDIQEHIDFVEEHKVFLADEEISFNDNLHDCSLQKNYSQMSLERCFQETIHKTRIRLFKLQKAVETYISIDRKERMNCVESTFSEMDDRINIAFKDFNSCVEKIMDDELNFR